MATNYVKMPDSNHRQSPGESWEDLVLWDGEIHDPLFGAPEHHVPESFPLDLHSAPPSAPPSLFDGLSSLDHAFSALSAPVSFADGPVSGDYTFSWLSSASPSFSTTATSPLIGRNDGVHRGPFDPFGAPPSAFATNPSSPLIKRHESAHTGTFGSFDASESAASPQTFNPFVASSPQAFGSFGEASSQEFANVGGWADQPQIIEPIPELEHERAVTIPQPNPRSYNSNYGSLPWAQETPLEQPPARAITIPQTNQRAASYNTNFLSSPRAREVRPVLSVSPDFRPRHRSIALSRSVSRSEPRRSRGSLIPPSPTSNTLGWVSYQPNHQTHRLVPSGADGNRGRRQRGRTKALTTEQRRSAALMRVIGACSNCKKRKEKCDPGIPCKSCLEHYKGDLINHPCRDRLLSDLSESFLSDSLGWHPTIRALNNLADGIGPNKVNPLTSMTYTIPLILGFGPYLHVQVNALHVQDTNALYHNHIVYSWPPSTSSRSVHTHVVLPALLTPAALTTLQDTLDTHLSLLVTSHFRSFPLYCSPLRILREIYVLYRSLPANSPHSRLLHQALKLLVLVHIGGDLTLPLPPTDPVLSQLIHASMAEFPDLESEISPTPCFIRAQLGSVMPELAMSLMRDVLSKLERVLLDRECQEWAIALAAILVLLMTVESIQYHDAKLPYHHSSNTNSDAGRNIGQETGRLDVQGAKSLLTFYSACFSGCHARLKPDWEGDKDIASSYAKSGSRQEDPVSGLRPEDKFVESVREAVKRAGQAGYLSAKVNKERDEGDMGWFFDRLVARLLLLKV
ncbi:hypothetical protein K469DRAFT_632778 [Zopfia rhizophila CBS 207.26]|uniref:Zn(2)-C6 fungal-type domain-containing protein n=1 Tax=Zopfia rhizophila CBS 207.26 TaxID=1314779 RepID=A0A6A6E371_9PEZI|nr:hypothetical protein K469DRAFT_632778 [Zopfia rhizophila CBS 207.26]